MKKIKENPPQKEKDIHDIINKYLDNSLKKMDDVYDSIMLDYEGDVIEVRDYKGAKEVYGDYCRFHNDLKKCLKADGKYGDLPEDSRERLLKFLSDCRKEITKKINSLKSDKKLSCGEVT